MFVLQILKNRYQHYFLKLRQKILVMASFFNLIQAIKIALL